MRERNREGLKWEDLALLSAMEVTPATPCTGWFRGRRLRGGSCTGHPQPQEKSRTEIWPNSHLKHLLCPSGE